VRLSGKVDNKISPLHDSLQEWIIRQVTFDKSVTFVSLDVLQVRGVAAHAFVIDVCYPQGFRSLQDVVYEIASNESEAASDY